MFFKPLTELKKGDTVCDMHYGIPQLTKHYKVVSDIRVRIEPEDSHATHVAIGQLTGRPYENKYLRVVNPVGYDDTVLCMFLYDGRTFGIIELGEKDEAGQ